MRLPTTRVRECMACATAGFHIAHSAPCHFRPSLATCGARPACNMHAAGADAPVTTLAVSYPSQCWISYTACMRPPAPNPLACACLHADPAGAAGIAAGPLPAVQRALHVAHPPRGRRGLRGQPLPGRPGQGLPLHRAQRTAGAQQGPGGQVLHAAGHGHRVGVPCPCRTPARADAMETVVRIRLDECEGLGMGVCYSLDLPGPLAARAGIGVAQPAVPVFALRAALGNESAPHLTWCAHVMLLLLRREQ